MKNELSKTAEGGSGGTGGSGGNITEVSATNATTAGTASRQTSCLDVQVSCFKDYNSPDNPVTVPLLTWLKSDKYRTKVDLIRKESDKDTRDKLKGNLPAVTVSGIFVRRDSKSLSKHSGLIAIDIDFKENSHIGNYSQLKEQICKISNVAYCGLSVSGTGYFAIIPIGDPAKHLQHSLALEKAFKRLGIVIDHKCKNIDRLRGYSFDPEPFFNFNAKTFTATYQEPRPIRIYYKSTGHNDTATVENCLNQLSTDITSDYGTWFEIGCSLATAFGESGRQYFHQVSRFYEAYTQRETDKQFDHCLKGYNKITLGTFFHHCKLAGIEPENNGGSPLPTGTKKVPVNEAPPLANLKPIPETPTAPEYDFAGNLIDAVLGYPVTWKIPTPLERMTAKYPNLKTLVECLQLESI